MWYLYIILITSHGSGINHSVKRVEVGDKASCLEILKATKIGVSNGNESESGFAAFCGMESEEELHDSLVWAKQKIGKLK